VSDANEETMKSLIDKETTETELWELWSGGEASYTEALRILEHDNCSSRIAVSIITNMPPFDSEEESGVSRNEYGVLFSEGLNYRFTSDELEVISDFLNDLVNDCYDSISGGSFPNDLMDILISDLPGEVARFEGHTVKSCRSLLDMVESFLGALEECPPDERLADLYWSEEIFNLAATVFTNSVTDVDTVQKLSKRVQEFQENSN
jgi:hypothetical protein